MGVMQPLKPLPMSRLPAEGINESVFGGVGAAASRPEVAALPLLGPASDLVGLVGGPSSAATCCSPLGSVNEPGRA